MTPAGNKAKCLSSVNHTTKTIHHHHHYHHGLIYDLVEEAAIQNIREVEGTLEIVYNFSVFSEKRGQRMQHLVQRFHSPLTIDEIDKQKMNVILLNA